MRLASKRYLSSSPTCISVIILLLAFLGGLRGWQITRQVGAERSEKHGPSMSMAAKALPPRCRPGIEQLLFGKAARRRRLSAQDAEKMQDSAGARDARELY